LHRQFAAFFPEPARLRPQIRHDQQHVTDSSGYGPLSLPRLWHGLPTVLLAFAAPRAASFHSRRKKVLTKKRARSRSAVAEERGEGARQ
jgi:hypothetical protein